MATESQEVLEKKRLRHPPSVLERRSNAAVKVQFTEAIQGAGEGLKNLAGMV
jgi:hypothetical protein